MVRGNGLDWKVERKDGGIATSTRMGINSVIWLSLYGTCRGRKGLDLVRCLQLSAIQRLPGVHVTILLESSITWQSLKAVNRGSMGSFFWNGIPGSFLSRVRLKLLQPKTKGRWVQRSGVFIGVSKWVVVLPD
jgi:hypothetical protein